MRNDFPWYDSFWLNIYVRVKKYLSENYPERLQEFIDSFAPLRTNKSFKTRYFQDLLGSEVLQEVRNIIRELNTTELEKQEFINFGRMVVHNHPYFTSLQNNLLDRVTDATGELVEHYYNFLSLYHNLGVCPVHLDAPLAKWTLDICIDQSHPWPIYLSETIPWPEDFIITDTDWQRQIKNDPQHQFT